MKRKKTSKVSLTDVAKKAGVSKSAASFAFQNRPGVSEETRERILKIAKRMGYVPDARIAEWMARVQDTKTKDLLPLAWLNTHNDPEAWQRYEFLSPYLEGARDRARELGYRIDEIWIREPGLTMRRLAQIVYQRGIEGVIVTHFAHHLRLNWDRLAGIALEGSLFAPHIDRVMTDTVYNLNLALKMVKRYGYRRVGICLPDGMDEKSAHSCRGASYYYNSSVPASNRIEPIFYPWGKGDENEAIGKKAVIEWIKKNKPDVIIGHSLHLVAYAAEAGYQVPEEMGVVHLATDDDVKDWAGVHSNRRDIGAAAANLAVSYIRNHQFGLPKTAMNIMIRGTWHHGRTLMVPNPALIRLRS